MVVLQRCDKKCDMKSLSIALLVLKDERGDIDEHGSAVQFPMTMD